MVGSERQKYRTCIRTRMREERRDRAERSSELDGRRMAPCCEIWSGTNGGGVHFDTPYGHLRGSGWSRGG
jgi:hypothetical protein